MREMTAHRLASAAAMLAVMGPMPTGIFSSGPKPRKTNFYCVKCDRPIPPGRDGRKCRECRKGGET